MQQGITLIISSIEMAPKTSDTMFMSALKSLDYHTQVF